MVHAMGWRLELEVEWLLIGGIGVGMGGGTGVGLDLGVVNNGSGCGGGGSRNFEPGIYRVSMLLAETQVCPPGLVALL